MICIEGHKKECKCAKYLRVFAKWISCVHDTSFAVRVQKRAWHINLNDGLCSLGRGCIAGM